MYIWRASQAPHYGRRGAGDAQTAPVSQHSNVVRVTQWDVNMGTAVNISPVKEIGMITLGQHVVSTYLPVFRVYVNH